MLNDTDVYVVAGDDKFVKLVVEGDSTIINSDVSNRADLSYEYTLMQKYGLAIALSEAFGVYRINA